MRKDQRQHFVFSDSISETQVLWLKLSKNVYFRSGGFHTVIWAKVGLGSLSVMSSWPSTSNQIKILKNNQVLPV